MNEVTQAQKDTTTKILAIIGFIAIIIFAVWLAVKVVQLIPGAFSSLASIADGVHNTNPQNGLTVAASKNIVNHEESFTINWTDTGRSGGYAFSYECTEGVNLEIRNAEGELQALPCNQIAELGSALGVDVIAKSDVRRFIDVPYQVTFTNSGATDTFFERTAQFTIVNAHIPQSLDIAANNAEEADVAGDVAGESTSTEEAPENTNTVAATPVVVEEPIFAIPTSNPNGFVDLAVTYLGVGHLENNNSFDPKAKIDNDERGSFRFAVRNIGTKTSEKWTFEATLPSGEEFESGERSALKPNERAIITLGFDAVGETGFKTITAEVDTDGDINSENNDFTWGVEVTN